MSGTVTDAIQTYIDEGGAKWACGFGAHRHSDATSARACMVQVKAEVESRSVSLSIGARNSWILDCADAGETFVSIAARTDVGEERVRQIVHRARRMYSADERSACRALQGDLLCVSMECRLAMIRLRVARVGELIQLLSSVRSRERLSVSFSVYVELIAVAERISARSCK